MLQPSSSNAPATADAWTTENAGGGSVADAVRAAAESHQQSLPAASAWVLCEDQHTYYDHSLKMFYDTVGDLFNFFAPQI